MNDINERSNKLDIISEACVIIDEQHEKITSMRQQLQVLGVITSLLILRQFLWFTLFQGRNTMNHKLNHLKEELLREETYRHFQQLLMQSEPFKPVYVKQISRQCSRGLRSYGGNYSS